VRHAVIGAESGKHIHVQRATAPSVDE